MIVAPSDPTRVQRSEEFREYSFGIKKDGLAHIFHVLRNQLYSDKVKAVIREYACNAVDEHTKLGKSDRPIKIVLPNTLSPQFRCRDYGPGLSEEDIRDVYANYGESTKRTSNDFIGQLGLGSKSAFAYTDSFTIVSYQQGTETTYNAYIDESNVGKIAKMSVRDTNEPDGIEIVIPVKHEDATKFAQTAAILFKYFPVTPEITGQDVSKFKQQDHPTILEGTGWRYSGAPAQKLNYNYGYQAPIPTVTSMAIMGNIGYPINAEQLKTGLTIGEFALVQTGLEVWFKIGDLDITASREALEYSKRTKEALTRRIKEVAAEMVVQIKKSFSEAQSYYEAKVIFSKLFSGQGGSIPSQLAEICGRADWKGIPVQSGEFRLDNTILREWGVTVISVSEHSGKKPYRFSTTPAYVLIARPRTRLFLNDTPAKEWSRSRMVTVWNEELEKSPEGRNKLEAYILTFPTPEVQKAFLEKYQLTDAPFKMLSEVPYSSDTVTDGSTPVAAGPQTDRSKKHATKTFVFSYNAGGSAHSDHWVEKEVNLEEAEGTYVILDRFYSQGIGGDPSQVQWLLQRLQAVGFELDTLYGFKVAMRQEVEKHARWKKLSLEVKKFLEKKFEDPILLRDFVEGSFANGQANVWSIFLPLANEIQVADSTFLNYLKLTQTRRIDQPRQVQLNQLSELCNRVQFNTTPLQDRVQDSLRSHLENVDKRYPLALRVLNTYNLGRPVAEVLKEILAYVNLVDRCKP
jgi:hypothetical protein